MGKVVTDKCGRQFEIYDLYTDVHNPITANTKKQIIANAVVFQNMGDSTVVINGNWTIAPGVNLPIGSQTDLNRVCQTFDIKFSGGITNRLEIMTLHLDIDGINEL